MLVYYTSQTAPRECVYYTKVTEVRKNGRENADIKTVYIRKKLF